MNHQKVPKRNSLDPGVTETRALRGIREMCASKGTCPDSLGRGTPESQAGAEALSSADVPTNNMLEAASSSWDTLHVIAGTNWRRQASSMHNPTRDEAREERLVMP